MVYKWRAYIGVFTSLVIIQLFGVLFSLNGTHANSMGSSGYHIQVQSFSANIILIFTIFWGFMTALLLATRVYREDDFAFVTNRTSSNLSTIIFLLPISTVGAFTAILSSFLLKVIVYFFIPADEKILACWVEGPTIFFVGLIATMLTVFLFSSFGYLAGMIIQGNKMFIILIPILIFGFSMIMHEKEKWSFDWDGETLALSAPPMGGEAISIFVEKAGSEKVGIEAFYYETLVSVNGMKVEKESSPKLEIKDATLSVYQSEHVNVKYQLLATEYPFHYFSENGKSEGSSSYITGWGKNALYVKVPEKVQVKSEPDTYTLVEE